MKSDHASTLTERPVYPTWIRSSRIVLFWLLAAGVVAIGVAVSFFWLPGLAIAPLALPFLYIAVVLTLATYRLGPRGGDLQARIHQLFIDEVGVGGKLLDVGCGSGQLLIRFAKSGPGEFVGLDYWGDDWEYSKVQAERNAQLEGVSGLEFVHGTASRLPFPDGAFTRVVSSLTFHEVRDVADKTASLVEALRVLESDGRFAFVDLFDDPGFYQGRERVFDAVRDAGGEIESVRKLTDIFELEFPMNLGKVLKYAVIVAGTKSPSARSQPANIEQLGAGDGERLRAIRLRALRDAPDAFGTTLEEAAARSPESWNRQLEQLATFVATASGCDLGLVRGAPHDRFRHAGYLISMWVAPEARRQGIGSALIDAVVHWARARGLSRLLLDVGERNTPAIALYTRKGFVPNGEVGSLPPPREHIREIQLVLRLTTAPLPEGDR